MLFSFDTALQKSGGPVPSLPPGFDATVTTSLKGVTTLEHLFGRKPNISHLRIFLSVSYMHIPHGLYSQEKSGEKEILRKVREN